MYFFIGFASLLAITAPLCIVSAALGINCRGSQMCWWTSTKPVSLTERFRQVVFASDKDLSTVYNDHEHVTCVHFPHGNNDGFCLFPQGASLTLANIRPLLDALIAHKCQGCGSVPIHMVDQGSNDPRGGILTINYVKNAADCNGNCIPASDEP